MLDKLRVGREEIGIDEGKTTWFVNFTEMNHGFCEIFRSHSSVFGGCYPVKDGKNPLCKAFSYSKLFSISQQ